MDISNMSVLYQQSILRIWGAQWSKIGYVQNALNLPNIVFPSLYLDKHIFNMSITYVQNILSINWIIK